MCIWSSLCVDTLTIALALQLQTQLDEKAEEVKQANDDLIEKVIMRPCAPLSSGGSTQSERSACSCLPVWHIRVYVHGRYFCQSSFTQ